MKVRIWGTRGSIATPGPSTLRFGGNTSCVELVTNAGQRFIFDCGTGARPLGMELMANAPKPVRATILLGHTHWDHIQGFPFFAPLFVPNNEFTICAPAGVKSTLAGTLAGQMEFTYFPVELNQLPARIGYRDLSEGTYDFDGVRVITRFLNHPATCLGYRIEADDAVVVYAADHEPFGANLWRDAAHAGQIDAILHKGDLGHAEFMKHADLLIHDAQYTPEEYPAKKNWGHSSFDYVVELAALADVRHLALTHHDPLHDDAALDEIEARARELARKHNFLMHVFCAFEGCSMEVSGTKSEHSRTVDVETTSLAASNFARVLVVDDDPNLRLLVSSALTRQGYEAHEAVDGAAGLRMIGTLRPDLVLLDLHMPYLDGMSVLKQLRMSEATRNLPVIILTAFGDQKSTQEGFDAGATDFLAKPFTIPQLTSRVRACMARETLHLKAAANPERR
jgi:CheY-like chemotaxis protein/phosphoribosyl 1,2-cyclic phosphodiesterase